MLATRSATPIDWTTITPACAMADIVVSDRRLPRGCRPAWLKLDRNALARTGGLAIYLGDKPRLVSVADRVGAHPWAEFALSSAPHREFAARRVDEVKPAAAREGEDRSGDNATGLGHGIERRFQVTDADDRQRR